MPPLFSNGADKSPKTQNNEELREFVSLNIGKCEKIASKIKEMTLSGNFDENREVRSTNFQAMAGLIDDFFRQAKSLVMEIKNRLRGRQAVLVELVKSKTAGVDSDEFTAKMKEIEGEINSIILVANGISEETGNLLAGMFEVLKDSAMSSYFFNSIDSEFDLKLNEKDSQSLVRPGLKMQILRLMRPTATHRFIPPSGEEDKSGVTTYQRILEQALENARAHKESERLQRVIQSHIGGQAPAVENKFDDEDEVTKITVSGPGIGEDTDDQDLPTLMTTQQKLMNQSRVKTLRPTGAMGAPAKAGQPPTQLRPTVTVVKDEGNHTPAAEFPMVYEKRKPISQNISAPVPKPVEPMRKPEPAPFVPPKVIKQPEEELSSPSPVIKKTRAKIWALLGAGVALAAAVIYSQSGDDNSKNADTTNTVTTTTATSHETPAPSPVEQKKDNVDNQKKAPKYTVNIDHSDYTKYTSNFTGMHSFLADLNYAASHSEFEMTGSETPNQVKLKALRGFLESGVKTATGHFAQKSFASYLNNLDHLEAEIAAGRLDVNSENLMKDGRYHQIRLMAEGIKNVVPAAPPENIAGYKIDQNNCHPLEVFTHNYLRAGGAPAFHTTVMNTLENITHEPFARNDTGHVTNEFFSRLHRQAAVQKAKNDVDGSPMVARSVERFLRAGGKNEIGDMLRGCVVPVYKDEVNAGPKDDDTVNTKGAMPINYQPSAPSPTGLNDTQKSQEWKDSWGEKSDTDAILGNITEMLADNEPEIELTEADFIVDDEPEIELTEADFIVDDEPEIELTEADFIVDDEPEIELTEADFIVDDEPAIELTEADIIVDDEPGIELTDEDIIIEEEPAPVKKSFFARAASKVKGLFA